MKTPHLEGALDAALDAVFAGLEAEVLRGHVARLGELGRAASAAREGLVDDSKSEVFPLRGDDGEMAWHVRVGGKVLPNSWRSPGAARAGLETETRRLERRPVPPFLRRTDTPEARLESAREVYRASVALREQVTEALVGEVTAGERMELSDAVDELWAALGRALFGPGGAP